MYGRSSVSQQEDGREGWGLDGVEDTKSYLKGQDVFCIEKDKRLTSTN